MMCAALEKQSVHKNVFWDNHFCPEPDNDSLMGSEKVDFIHYTQ